MMNGTPAMDRPAWKTVLLQQLLVAVVAGLVFFTNLGAATLFDEDEPKNAECGREMFLRNDWIVPTFNDELRTDKPILIYWAMLCSYTVFGVTEFAARFGSSVLAVGTCLLTYHLGRMLFSPRVGLLAGIVLATSLMFSAVGRAVTPDSFLIFNTTLAFTAYCWAVSRRLVGHFSSPKPEAGSLLAWHELSPYSFWTAIPMYVAMGLAVLAKGPIGVLLPCAIIGLNLLVQQQRESLRLNPAAVPADKPLWRRWLTTLMQVFAPRRIGAGMLAMRVPLGAVIVAAIALPWYVAVGQATDGAWLRGFLGDHNVGRFLEPKENHSGPFFYYLVVISLGCFPWSMFLPLAIWRIVQQIRSKAVLSPGQVFVCCWAGFWILFFSCASTKLPNYILPAYPALALLVASFLVEWETTASAAWVNRFRWSSRGIGLAGIVLMIALPVVTTLLLPRETWLVLIGLIPVAGSLMILTAVRRGDRRLAVQSVAGTAVVLAVTIVGIAPAFVCRYQDGPHFGRLARQMASDHVPELATWEYFAPTLVFYAEAPVARLKEPGQIGEFFAAHPEAMLLTREDRLDQIRTELPPEVSVLAKQRRFLRRHDLVLLGRPTEIARAIPEPATAVSAH